MPVSGKKWRHVIINTRSSWLHGDPRGFRSRGHRIHSSGDYKHRPPKGEHEGLHRYRREHSRPEVRLNPDVRPLIGWGLIEYLHGCEHQVLVVAITKVHAHLLAELPDNISRVRAIMGKAKQYASRQVKAYLRGQVWARGGTFKPVNTRQHHRSAYDYILYDQGPNAWTWCFQDESDDGQIGRRRC
ncbi:MAG TPA: hypothetical protein VN541_13150 [Tepidisphaeraceae bacterium]|nr:hypothetical protein [Tepidisphaeraceae bacterium]